MGADKSSAGGRVRLVLLASAVLVSHTLVTVLEERLFSIAAFKAHSGGAFMTLFMYLTTALVYSVRTRKQGLNLATTSARRLLLTVSMLYVGTTTLTKTSLRYIDMPTQTVLKLSLIHI